MSQYRFIFILPRNKHFAVNIYTILYMFTVLITFSTMFPTTQISYSLDYSSTFNESQYVTICPIIMNNIVHCVAVVVVFTPSVLSTYMSRVSRK